MHGRTAKQRLGVPEDLLPAYEAFSFSKITAPPRSRLVPTSTRSVIHVLPTRNVGGVFGGEPFLLVKPHGDINAPGLAEDVAECPIGVWGGKLPPAGATAYLGRPPQSTYGCMETMGDGLSVRPSVQTPPELREVFSYD